MYIVESLQSLRIGTGVDRIKRAFWADRRGHPEAIDMGEWSPSHVWYLGLVPSRPRYCFRELWLRLLPTGRLGSADPARRQVDLLVTDLVMPQINGLDLAHRIMAAHPENLCALRDRLR